MIVSTSTKKKGKRNYREVVPEENELKKFLDTLTLFKNNPKEK